MQTYAFILANITDCMDHAPELAMSVASKNMDWLFGHDIPGLNTMLLTELPVLRKDHGMMRGYMFLMDFLEVVSEQTSSMILGNQRLMRSLFEAAKVSETYADEFIHKNADKVRCLHLVAVASSHDNPLPADLAGVPRFPGFRDQPPRCQWERTV